ncbi:GreA/GreB family elongation factor [Singulisphaera sp. GP187]|uniref:nucleoside diphosphate kinase regulator n=1 Tax=Singulisphaera sp. GP187 TaxID=1882752 RepID=UPI00092ACDB8|nr:nucleoside diphosphate kinase regulator [Singulisphaera sp. GP187]SIO65884.1 GreA/GreB family elongation factor [Singulisphaera sp. GP187]
MNGKKIYITQFDRDRLDRFLGLPRDEEQNIQLNPLRSELARAVVVAPQEIPADVITMNSTVSLIEIETSEEEVFTLVFPKDADADEGKISVTAPLGTAMLGYRVGDVFDWDVPMGRKRWRVAKVLYQPEAAGNYEL